MAMIPGGQAGGAIILGQAARGFGGAVFQGLRDVVHGAAAAPVTIQMPAGGMNTASAAAITAIAAQISTELAGFIQQITPYVKGSFWAFVVILVLVITEKIYAGPIGVVLGSACRGLLVLLRAGAPYGQAGAIKFFNALLKVFRALYALPSAARSAILERVVAIQNYAERKIRTVRDGLIVVRGYVKRAKNAVVGTMRRSLARVKAAGARVGAAARSAHTAMRGFRARRAAGRAAKNNASRMAMQQKVRLNLAAINQRVVANEERRIRNLINKVKRTAAPLSSREKREYIALAHRAEKKALANAAGAKRNITAANRQAGIALMNLSGRKSH